MSEKERTEDTAKIMCFVCKKMVPKNDMVEIEYSAGKKVWVLPKYIKFNKAEQ